ncbi:hypothetical protein PV08_03585 [Exophiala spinifera]|uniref:BTB domain-containing protein n=1 Tax=Exophiala spinifera TaxID=91928 RepID=A0A0D1YVG7_9EURO|nr:uncharacterized protein PV08_03585 [Exophiala spinifera]KIW19291.1 hypothetical protein PV08_03585 [Exophiala spinifera]
MDVKHARSPVIKVIVGDDEDFVDTAEGRIQPNVFYVHKSFLVHHSRYFRTLLDSALPHDITVIRLQLPEGCDYEMFASWLTVLYADEGTLNDLSRSEELGEIRSLFAIASFLESSSSKNLLLDAIQRRNPRRWTLVDLQACREDELANELLYDYVLECVAYSIVVPKMDPDEWSDHIDVYIFTSTFYHGFYPGHEYGDSDYRSHSRDCWEDVVHRIGELREDKYKDKLKNPGKRKDCKWHEHTDQDRIECPRYRNEYNPRR